MNLILVLLVLIMILISYVTCLVIQWKIAKSLKGRKFLKSLGNLLLFIIIPAILALILSMVLYTFDKSADRTGFAITVIMIYLMYLYFAFIAIPIKAILLVITHCIGLTKLGDKDGLKNNSNYENIKE